MAKATGHVHVGSRDWSRLTPKNQTLSGGDFLTRETANGDKMHKTRPLKAQKHMSGQLGLAETHLCTSIPLGSKSISNGTSSTRKRKNKSGRGHIQCQKRRCGDNPLQQQSHDLGFSRLTTTFLRKPIMPVSQESWNSWTRGIIHFCVAQSDWIHRCLLCSCCAS